ncbi:MAG: PEGA domain-containing protein [Polyangiaceae bacterium]
MKTAVLSACLSVTLLLATAASAGDPPAPPPSAKASASSPASASAPLQPAPSAQPSASTTPAPPPAGGEGQAKAAGGAADEQAPTAPASPPPQEEGDSQSADKTAAARVLFEAGSKAYAAGNYRAAIQAFEQAYAVSARPGLLFSMAQAHRRQYKVDGRPGHVAVAIKQYKDYLAAQRTGGRRADAEAALAELAPEAQKLEREGRLQPFTSEEVESATRLIVTSPVQGVRIAVDGSAEGREAPLIAELSPGRHKVRVYADNHFEEVREIEVTKGAVTALDMPLRPRPALLSIDAPPGGRVSLDGRYVGETPFPAPLELPLGEHTVRIVKDGYGTFTQTLDAGAGQKLTVAATMPMTTQRKVAIGLIGTGAASIAGGILFGGLALVSQADAQAVQGDMNQGKVVCRGQECPELDRYNTSVRARDAFRAGAFSLLGVGALAGGAGLFLYLVDGVPPFTPARTDSTSPAKAAGAHGSKGTQGSKVRVSAAPVIAPGTYGVMLSGEL